MRHNTAPLTRSALPQVRPAYSKPVPVLHTIDPMRTEGGFVRGPNVIPGAAPPPQSPLIGRTTPADFPLSSSNELKMSKQMYTSMHASRIPVNRAFATQRPRSAYPASHKFMHVFAGKEGGLGLMVAFKA